MANDARPKVCVLIPAHNEAPRLDALLTTLTQINNQYELTVLDSASTDNTPTICNQHDVRRTYIPIPGKGKALKKGIEDNASPIIVMIDGDNSYDPAVIPEMVQILSEGTADIVYGSRFMPLSVRNDMTLVRYTGNKLLQYAAKMKYGHAIDFTSGLTAINRTALESLKVTSDGFEFEAELFGKAMKSQLTATQIPIQYSGNKTSKLKPVQDGMLIIRKLLKPA